MDVKMVLNMMVQQILIEICCNKTNSILVTYIISVFRHFIAIYKAIYYYLMFIRQNFESFFKMLTSMSPNGNNLSKKLLCWSCKKQAKTEKIYVFARQQIKYCKNKTCFYRKIGGCSHFFLLWIAVGQWQIPWAKGTSAVNPASAKGKICCVFASLFVFQNIRSKSSRNVI